MALLFEDPAVPQLTWDTTLAAAVGAARVHESLAAVTLEAVMQHRSGLLTDLTPEVARRIQQKINKLK
jgi:hypothetical protein